jgi:hypothetical protein
MGLTETDTEILIGQFVVGIGLREEVLFGDRIGDA